jgi:hypothetical protein
MMTLLMSNAMGPWSYTATKSGSWHPLLVIGPGVASALHGFGISKSDIRSHIYKNAMISAGLMERYAHQVGSTSFNLAELVREGRVGPEYALNDDPARLVRMIPRADLINIVVAGNPSRNQSRAYINNHVQGATVTRPVTLPRDWSGLRERTPGREK